MTADLLQWRRGENGFIERVNGRLFNRLPVARAPHRLVAPRSEEELIEVVLAARRNGHKVAVRSGGHSWIGSSVRDQGVLVDMGAFDRLDIDAGARIARVGPAVRGEGFGRALASLNLAFPVGHCGGPAMGGYLLAGGIGLNWATWKPACFSIRRIRVVTAAGELLVADDTHNSELLWMARGAGPGFPGIVTEFELALQERPADVRVSSWYFTMDAVDEVTRWVTEASPGLALNVEVATATAGPNRTTLPPREGHPSHLVCVTAIAFTDSLDEARAALSPLSAGPGVPALHRAELEPIPFEDLYQGADASFPAGQRVLADSFWSDRDVHALLPDLAGKLALAPSGSSFVVAIMPGHGASRSGWPTDTGVFSMDEKTWLLTFAVWDDAGSDVSNRAWMADLVDAVGPLSTGYFVGETDLTRHARRAARSFSPGHWERLTRLRARWDPDGVFHGYLQPPSAGHDQAEPETP